jgi:hypothetical protein
MRTRTRTLAAKNNANAWKKVTSAGLLGLGRKAWYSQNGMIQVARASRRGSIARLRCQGSKDEIFFGLGRACTQAHSIVFVVIKSSQVSSLMALAWLHCHGLARVHGS